MPIPVLLFRHSLVARLPQHTQTRWRSDHSRRRIVSRTSGGEVLVVERFCAHQIAGKDIVSTTGAGDSLVGTLLAAEASALKQCESLFWDPDKVEEAMEEAQAAAVRSLRSGKAVASRENVPGHT